MEEIHNVWFYNMIIIGWPFMLQAGDLVWEKNQLLLPTFHLRKPKEFWCQSFHWRKGKAIIVSFTTDLGYNTLTQQR